MVCTAAPHSKKVPGSNPSRGLSVWCLHVLLVLAWVFSGYTTFLPQSVEKHVPQSKNMHVRLVGDSKLHIRVIVSVCGTGLPSQRDC